MEKLFIQLIYIMFFLIKYTKCDIYLEKIEEITETDKNETLLFTEYKKNSLLGVSNQNIYIISPFRVTKINYNNRYSLLEQSTNIISLDDDTFALVCLKEVLIAVYNITGALISNYSYEYESGSSKLKYSPFIGIQCGVTYQNNNFYIGIPDNKTNNIQFFYLILKKDSNTLSEKITIQLDPSNYFLFQNFNILIYNVNNYSLIILPKNELYIRYYFINLTNSEIIYRCELNHKIMAKGGILKDTRIIIFGKGEGYTLTLISFEISNTEQPFEINSNVNITFQNNNIIPNTIDGYIKNATNFSIMFSGGGSFYEYFFDFNLNSNVKPSKISFFPKPADKCLSSIKVFNNNNTFYTLLKELNTDSFNWTMNFKGPKCKNYMKYEHKKDSYNLTLNELAEKQDFNINITILLKNVEGITVHNLLNNSKNAVLNYTLFSFNENIYEFSSKFSLYFNVSDKIEENDIECELKIQICDISCDTCSEYSESNDKKCLSCADNYYPLEDNELNCTLKTSKIDNYFFSEEYSKFMKCKDNCKICENLSNCTQCNDGSLWFVENDILNCLTSESCPESFPYFNIDTLECVKDCNINDNCIKCNNTQIQQYNKCIEKEKEIENNIGFFGIYPLNDPKVTYIDIGECENILKEKNKISELYINIIEKNEGKLTNKVNFDLYDKEGNKLNISECDDIPISFSFLLTNTENLNLDEGKRLSELGIDIYNINDNYFNDFCLNNDIGKRTDIIIKDRQNDIYVKADFCDSNCIYKGTNYETFRVKCECYNNDYSNNNNGFNNKRKSAIMEFIDDHINYKIIVCYKYIFLRTSYKNNWGFIFCLSIIIVCSFCTFLHYWKTINILKTRINNYIILPKNHNKKNLKPNPQRKKNKEDIKIYGKKPIITNEITNKNLQNKQKKYNKNMNLKSKIELKDNPNSTQRQLKNNKIIKPNLIIEKDIDYEDMNFFIAIYKDKRNLLSIIYTSFLSKVDIIRIIFFPKQYDILYIAISSFLFSIIVDFTINALLFSDVILSQKYKSGNNQLRFITSELLSIFADILGSIFCFFLTRLINFSIPLEMLQKEIKFNDKIIKYVVKAERIIRIRLFIYFTLQFFFLCFFMYYIIIFCSLYKYSQYALFKSYLFGVITHLIYSLVISLVISILRFISLKNKKIKIFLLSQYLNNLF